jgi:hypothetical protein
LLKYSIDSIDSIGTSGDTIGLYEYIVLIV